MDAGEDAMALDDESTKERSDNAWKLRERDAWWAAELEKHQRRGDV